MQKPASNKKIIFNTFLPGEALWVKGDPMRVKQILLNLVNNAIKFTDEGHVDLSLIVQEQAHTHTKVEIRVTDTGIGLTEEEAVNCLIVLSKLILGW